MFEPGVDQAAGLRRLFGARSMRLLPIVADDRPTGTAAFAVSLAAALTRQGHRPLVVDAHRQGVIFRFGLEAPQELRDLMAGRCSFAQALRCTGDGVSVLAAQIGLSGLADDPVAGEAVFSALASLKGAYDVTLLHAPADILGPLLQTLDVETALLCGPDECDLTDTYARLKSMVNDSHLSQFRAVFHGVSSHADVAGRHRRLADAASRFLGAEVAFGGTLGLGADLATAARERTSVFGLAAQGQTARAFERIASASRDWRLAAYAPDRRTIH